VIDRHSLLVSLNLLRWRGLGLTQALLTRLSDPVVLLSKSVTELVAEEGMTREGAEKIVRARESLSVERHIEDLVRREIAITTQEDPGYPELLRAIPDPPLALYHRGPLPDRGRMVVAIVGTRAATPYGIGVATRMARDLAQAGALVVSGLAEGIDTAAHSGAIEVGTDRTLAVLATGVDICYPPGNRLLYKRLDREGTLLSEAPPGTTPKRHLFPLRNRIISGLSRSVIVVEAPERSGALITARLAADQGRDVFAVPGPVTSLQSQGCLALLQQGAAMARNAKDVLEEALGRPSLGKATPDDRETSTLDAEERHLLGLLSPVGTSIDELVSRMDRSFPELHQRLLTLVERGLASRLPGNRYASRS